MDDSTLTRSDSSHCRAKSKSVCGTSSSAATAQQQAASRSISTCSMSGKSHTHLYRGLSAQTPELLHHVINSCLHDAITPTNRESEHLDYHELSLHLDLSF